MKRIFGILALVLLLGLTGCSGEETTEEFSVQTGKDAQTVAIQDDFTLSMRVPETLNPLRNRDASVDRILKLVFLPLIGQADNGKPESGVAQSWTLSADGSTLSVVLQDNLNWQDGTPVTADDVVFSYQTIVNAPEDSVYKHVTDYVASCTKTGSKTVNIQFRRPFSGNLSALYFPIIPASYYQGAAETNDMQPMGNGPYRVESYTMASSLTLVANENYIKGAPNIKKIQVRITAGEDTDVFSLSQGILDAMVMDATEAGKYLTTEDQLKSYAFDSGIYDFVGFNFGRELFLDKNMRQAIAYAIPKDYIYESIYLQYAQMTNTPVSPQFWLYEENVVSYSYDPQMTETLLKNAGWADTNQDGVLERTQEDGSTQELRISILVNQENTARKQIAATMKEELETVGFAVTIEEQTYEVYSEKLQSGDFDLVVGGWRMSEVLDLTPFFATGGAYNYIGYTNEEIDQLLTAAQQAIQEGEMLLAYSNLQKRLSEELPYISIAYRQDVLMVSEEVTGEIQPNRINVFQNMESWNIENGA